MALVREGDALAGAVGQFSVAALFKGLVVSAVEDGRGNLKLITWMVSADGSGTTAGGTHVNRVADIDAGAIGRVALVADQVSHNGDFFCRMITAVRTGGKLKLIAWRCGLDGKHLKRKDDATAGAVTEVAIDQLTTSLYVTAVRRDDGHLEVMGWKVTPEGDQITPGASKSAGNVSRVAVVGTGPFSDSPSSWLGFVTAVETEGHLKVIAWEISPDGTEIKRRGDESAGAIGDLAAFWYTTYSDVGFTNERDVVVTAVRTASDKLELIAWTISRTTSGKVTRIFSVVGDELSKIAVGKVGTPFKSDAIVAAGRGADGKLALSLWDLHSSTGFAPTDTASAGNISDVALARVWTQEIVTAVKTDGHLKLIAWKHS